LSEARIAAAAAEASFKSASCSLGSIKIWENYLKTNKTGKLLLSPHPHLKLIEAMPSHRKANLLALIYFL